MPILKRLVHQQDRRFGGKGAGKADALLHAARQFAHLAVRPLCQVDQRQLRINAGRARLGGQAGKFQPKAHVFPHRPPWQQAELLEDHCHPLLPDPAQRHGVGVGHIH